MASFILGALVGIVVFVAVCAFLLLLAFGKAMKH